MVLGGYTTGWVRYIRTGQALVDLQSDFRLEWEKFRLKSQSSSIDAARVEEGIDRCKQFLARLHSTVRTETGQWAQEFEKALIELDKKIKK